MSITVTIECDDCLDQCTPITGYTVAEAKEKARAAGWKLTRDADYCDWCAQKDRR